MKYTLHHQTNYSYSDRVSYSQHLAHLRPLDSKRQKLHLYRLNVSPILDSHTSHIDYYGNSSEYFSVMSPHNELQINAYSELEVFEPNMLTLDLSPSWEEVRDLLQLPVTPEHRLTSEFTFPSRHCPHISAIAEYAKRAFTPQRHILKAALALNSMIHEEFTFDPKATTVSTSVEEVFMKKAGVCQDFAHLQISALRSLGLAAKYVSGYIRTIPPLGTEKLVGADASHAWIALYVPELGWIEYDATNNMIPGKDHITVAYGRDYEDVCPIRGVVYGGGNQILSVGVTVSPVD